VYLRSAITGIGTVTYYDPENKTFGALGHGVNTPDGAILPLKTGTVYEAAILSVRKGTSGNPGQLLGTLSDPTPLGQLQKNTAQAIGLLGIYTVALVSRSTMEPRLVGKQLGLDPLITLVSLYAGYLFWGIGGMLLSPMLCVIVKEAITAPA
jgi:stage IV sporulation protein B